MNLSVWDQVGCDLSRFRFMNLLPLDQVGCDLSWDQLVDVFALILVLMSSSGFRLPIR